MKQDIYEINLDFAVLRELIVENGLEKPKCTKHAIRWYYKCSDYATKNMIYVLSQQNFSNVKVNES